MKRASMVLVDCFVPGPPHSQKPWVSRVIDATLGQPRVAGACELDVEFAVPPDRVSWILPSETRLSTVLKVLLDTLEETVLRDVADDGGGLVAIQARRKIVHKEEETGTRIVVRRANGPG